MITSDYHSRRNLYRQRSKGSLEQEENYSSYLGIIRESIKSAKRFLMPSSNGTDLYVGHLSESTEPT